MRDISLSKTEKTHNYHFIEDIFKDNSQIKTVFIYLDNDSAGRKAAEIISNLLKDKYTVKGVGDLFGKALRGKVTGESAIKPEYTGNGTLVLEPTYKHIILMNTADWNGAVVLDDGLFLACDSALEQKAVMRTHISSAALGGEGLFNLGLTGNGIFAIESRCPREELIEIELDNDVLKVDGNLALAWSKSLEFTVERSGKTLVGSAASGEGLVNVYRGTGKVLLAPIDKVMPYTMN